MTKVNYKNPERAPLLLVTGAEDRICPPSVNKANFGQQKKAPSATEHKEYPGRCHFPGQDGWEEVADYILDVDHEPRADERVSGVRITHIGGPTVLIEVGGWRLLTDPTFDPPGKRYFFGWGTMSRKLAGPAIAAADLGRIDAVLLSHDHHDDNLDPAGRALLPSAGVVVTTASGAKRLGGRAAGWSRGRPRRLEAPGRPAIEITATPCRHGPPLSHPIVGDVIGFALRWDGQEHGVLWISGDTVLYDGVREVADRLEVDTALLHLGGVQFPVSGPLRYTMTAKRRGGAVRPHPPAHGRSRSTTRGGSTSARGARRSSASSRRRRRTFRRASAGCPSARGWTSPPRDQTHTPDSQERRTVARVHSAAFAAERGGGR